jgi:hypothetical protein
MRPYILFILMLGGGVALTAAIGNILESWIAHQELRREQTYEWVRP